MSDSHERDANGGQEPRSGTVLSSSDEQATPLAVPSEILPLDLHVLPLTERPMFPVQTLPVVLDEEPWIRTVEAVSETAHRVLGTLLLRPDADPAAGVERFHEIGTAARVHQPARQGDRLQFFAEGRARFRVVKWISKKPPYVAQVEYLHPIGDESDREHKAYAMAIIGVIKKLIPLNPLYNEEVKLFLSRSTPNQPSFLADFAANLTSATGEELQEVLAASVVLERMQHVLALLQKELDAAQLHAQISRQVEQKMGEQQRKFFLQEQLKVIQEELGLTKDDRTADAERFRERFAELEPNEEARSRFDEEIEKLSVLQTGSPEYAVTRNYLDWLVNLPWGVTSEDRLDLERAREVLDADHAGLDDVKDRIVEFLAVARLRGSASGSILLLVGPPGVGKTSVGRSIASALGREFYRFSLGGMRDEAEIKGHRRTYIGAMPGKILHALRQVGVANPVIMLDEVDKVGASYHGDPASALLEVLDPEQNADFRDHFVDLPFDLSRVLFICTANQLDTIPGPLLDRMEVIRLSGYITEEKVAIARRHLWPRQLRQAGIGPGAIRVTDAALARIIEDYAREAGVRGLDKQLGRIIRKAAVEIVDDPGTHNRIGPRAVPDYLGRPTFAPEKPLSGVGIVTGLAWTPLGGASLDIEASRVHTRHRGFKLTGNLGDVMRESAEIAFSYVSSNLARFGADPGFFDEAMIHLHVPAGATPKDGPSAGISMAAALVSLARRRRPKRRAAMTGELTLTGQVLPVGGIREKLVAARRVGVSELILPEANRPDYEDLPDHIREGLTVHHVKHFRDVFAVLFDA